MAFEAKRALLNPRFEAYRLIDDNDEDASSRAVEHSFPLPGSTFSSSSSAAAPLGYKELKDRSRHPHLAAGARPNQAAYIDGNGFVVLVTFEPEVKRSMAAAIRAFADSISILTGPTPVIPSPSPCFDSNQGAPISDSDRQQPMACIGW